MRRLKPTRYIRPGSIKVADKLSDAVAYLWNARNGKPAAPIYYGKQSKPISDHWYGSEARRAKAIEDAFKDRQEHFKRKGADLAERKSWVPTYKVGDIFRTCWGYEQTNVEYFEITEIKGKYAILREIAQERSATGWAQGQCVPMPGQYLEPRFPTDEDRKPMRRLMQKHGIKIDEVRTAWLVEGDTIGGVRVIQPSSWTAYH